jgi:ABC-type phosphate transport system permease subunit
VQPPPDSFIVEIIRPETAEVTVVDVLVGSIGLAGALAFVAVPLGLLAGWLLIRRKQRHRPEDEHMPSIRRTSDNEPMG